ncbi:transmembrane protein 161-like emei isoform X2 [Arctopsyche grandis]|uniref:transmembrane protein 161-like emei isoform X2 n=1 Tax=Arctopsyche grandis TaxID=121162 RepID=UPI00406D9870
MALLGAQLVITLVMVSVIQKIGSHYSFARWLLCSTGLFRYLYPTDDELRTLAGVPKEKGKSKKSHKGSETNGKVETFHVSRSLDIQLDTAKVSPLDVIHLRYYAEYQWLVDFALYSAVVYSLTEVYINFFPLKDELNLSMMWCLLVLGFSFKILVTLTLQYFSCEESIGERSTCIVSGCAYLLLAMMIMIVDEQTLEVGLEKAYTSFNESASIFLNNQGLSSNGPASKLVIKFFMAVWCGIMGSLFTFPGLRIARMHWDSLNYCKENKMLQLLLNISFILPFILVTLWIKPITRDHLTTKMFAGMQQPLMTESGFDSLRFILVACTVILRIALMPLYLQAYLNMAYNRVEEQKKEAGRITNLDLQKKIAAVFYYLCVVTLQYVAPLIMCLYFSLMYKTLGGYTWKGLFFESPGADECGLDALGDTTISTSDETNDDQTVFTTDVFRGLLGFATWWSCFIWFATSSMGMVYQSYFHKS